MVKTIPMDYETDVRKIDKDDVASSIAMVLFGKRMEKGLDQADVAEILGISQCRLSEFEDGKRIPSITTMIALANFYECTVDDLLCRNPIRVKNR